MREYACLIAKKIRHYILLIGCAKELILMKNFSEDIITLKPPIIANYSQDYHIIKIEHSQIVTTEHQANKDSRNTNKIPGI